MSKNPFNDFITCPHCGLDDYLTDGYPIGLDYDDDEAKHTCPEPNCKKEFYVTVRVTREYSSNTKSADEIYEQKPETRKKTEK